MSTILPIKMHQKLHSNPTKEPIFPSTIKTKSGESLAAVSPTATRAMVALMDMEAVMGGAASHFGGPSAFAEMMSALFSYMFLEAKKKNKNWHELFHFVNDAGHCENGLYALKANYQLAGLSIDSLKSFRRVDSTLTGHGEAHLFPESVYISNGPLGSGLPQAQGLAAAESLQNSPRTTVVAISDGGCMEGEAREAFAAIPGLAIKKKMGPVLCLLSDNNTKLSGRIDQDSFSMVPTFKSLAEQGWTVIPVSQGNDLQSVFTAIEDAVEQLRSEPHKPILLWCKTVKGKGVKKTEESASGGHGFPLKKAEELPAFLKEIFSGSEIPAVFLTWMNELIDREQKKSNASTSGSASTAPTTKKEKIQDGVSRALIDAVEKFQLPVISVSSDLQGSTGMEAFRKKFPQHTFEVGVAEANMVSMGIGLSKQGYVPVVDTFAQFAVTKGSLPLIMSGLSEAPVMGIFSHTGFQDAADGASHQALAYLAMLGSIPHVETYCLSCSDEAYQLVLQASQKMAENKKQGRIGKSYIFFLGRETFLPTFNSQAKYELGHAYVVAEAPKNLSPQVMIAVSGSLVAHALKAQTQLAEKGVGALVVNPLVMNITDVDFFKKQLARVEGRLVTVEDHRVVGGMGACLLHNVMNAGVSVKACRSLGVGDEFGRSSYTADELYKIHHIDSSAIAAAVTGLF